MTTSPQTLLTQAHQRYAVPVSELKILLCHATGWTKTELMMRANVDVTEAVAAQFHALASKRQQGQPMAYILGTKEFYSRPFAVSPHCLIPRPETEELVDVALAWLRERHTQQRRTLNVLDVGTGSGVIAISLALEVPFLYVAASDISQAALALASYNAQQLDAQVEFFTSNYLTHIPNNLRFDLIISNPPYIANSEPHLHEGDLRFEPRQALTDEADGLSAYRHLSQQAMHYLKPTGMLLVEHGYQQQADVINVFNKAGLACVTGYYDMAGHPRMASAILG